MACVVCGSAATVKSHIIPRSLFRLEAIPGKQVIANLRDGPGYTYLQSGFWDSNILCLEHEGQLHGPDDYAFHFCRRLMQEPDPDQAVTIPNPEPARLVAFAAACVWRMAASRSKGRPHAMLGPYASRIQDLLFENAAFDPLLLVSRSAYVNRSEAVKLGTLPHLYHELGIRFWRFIACGIVFDLKLDNRAAPPAMAVLAVNAAPEITLFPDFPQQVLRDRSVATSLLAMSAPRRPHRR